MKIIIAGGSGLIGKVLLRAWENSGHDIVVLSRNRSTNKVSVEKHRQVYWNGVDLGPWSEELEGADVIINLAGRTVDCRYNARNLKQMMDSRVQSTRVIDQAIAQSKRPPRIWLQSSTATIYAHRFDAANDDETGILGSPDDDNPSEWIESIKIAQAWEEALFTNKHPNTRKVALRTSLVMSPDKGGVFDILSKLCSLGMGYHGSGRQYVSWVHETDFTAIIELIIAQESLSGPINISAPHPLPNREFIQAIHRVVKQPLSIKVSVWILEIGAFFMRTESELLMKSRRVISSRLMNAGYEFKYPHWEEAAAELYQRK